ncbi:MAG: hypothetical protein OXI87_02375 [Albidovulum sp.]|nr:hypothetical protein [Albidovulum sp.]MDE0529985.1 hypothetical protein [Albidovulum sp.]
MCLIRPRSAVPESCWPRQNSRTTVGFLRVSGEEHGLAKSRAVILALANREDIGRVEFVDERRLPAGTRGAGERSRAFWMKYAKTMS